MLNFEPLSDQDILNLLPDGEYDFLVKSASNHRSKTGNHSIKLVLCVYDSNGNEHALFCFLSVNYMFLLKHFCDATGLKESYEKGILSPELCENKSGRCKVIIEEPAEGTNFLPKNVIKDFIKPIKENKGAEFIDSDIAF